MYLIINEKNIYKSRLIGRLGSSELVACKEDFRCMLFNLDAKEYFNPKENVWVAIPTSKEI